MNKRILTILFILVAISLNAQKQVFNFELNKVNSIKDDQGQYGIHYKPIEFTPTLYTFDKNIETLIFKAIYKLDTIGVSFAFHHNYPRRLVIESIGVESDNFVQALSELYEVKISSPKMKKSFSTSLYLKDQQNAYIHSGPQHYGVLYEPIKGSPKGSTWMSLFIDVSKGIMQISAKDGDIGKNNYVNAFVD
ncbi:MAG: hypothetical protein MRY83_15880 [Flavobacteriales bacterium]|nr:hypothetical protein [Flavobacteriales bacterium]